VAGLVGVFSVGSTSERVRGAEAVSSVGSLLTLSAIEVVSSPILSSREAPSGVVG
jgi:hypothetical protein